MSLEDRDEIGVDWNVSSVAFCPVLGRNLLADLAAVRPAAAGPGPGFDQAHLARLARIVGQSEAGTLCRGFQSGSAAHIFDEKSLELMDGAQGGGQILR
jgi:hypothetical protein